MARLHLPNPLPYMCHAGDDIWVPDETHMNHTGGGAYHTAHPYSVHQIEWISEERDYIHIDYPLGSHGKHGRRVLTRRGHICNQPASPISK